MQAGREPVGQQGAKSTLAGQTAGEREGGMESAGKHGAGYNKIIKMDWARMQPREANQQCRRRASKASSGNNTGVLPQQKDPAAPANASPTLPRAHDSLQTALRKTGLSASAGHTRPWWRMQIKANILGSDIGGFPRALIHAGRATSSSSKTTSAQRLVLCRPGLQIATNIALYVRIATRVRTQPRAALARQAGPAHQARAALLPARQSRSCWSRPPGAGLLLPTDAWVLVL